MKRTILFLSARIAPARVTDVRVGGSTILVAKGRLFLPRCTCFQQDFISPSDGIS